jgi:hypothetical protein
MELRERILGAPPQLRSETVVIPEWDAAILVRELTAGERDRFDSEHAAAGKANLWARLVVAMARTQDGERVFQDGDLQAVAAMPSRVLEPLVDAAVRLANAADQSVEALEKN